MFPINDELNAKQMIGLYINLLCSYFCLIDASLGLDELLY